MRVTQTKRKCPHCAYLVTPEDIDKQAKWNSIGGAIASVTLVGAIWLCCVAPSGTGAALLNALIALVVLAVIAFVVYIGYKVYEGRKLDAKKVDFLRSADYQLISDFARSEMRYEEGAHEKLYELIKQRGWNLRPEELDDFEEKEWDDFFHAEQTEWFTKQIREKNLSRPEEYMKAYAELTHPHEDKYIHVLASFLKVGEADYPRLQSEVASLAVNPDLDEFERRLRGEK